MRFWDLSIMVQLAFARDFVRVVVESYHKIEPYLFLCLSARPFESFWRDWVRNIHPSMHLYCRDYKITLGLLPEFVCLWIRLWQYCSVSCFDFLQTNHSAWVHRLPEFGQSLVYSNEEMGDLIHKIYMLKLTYLFTKETISWFQSKIALLRLQKIRQFLLELCELICKVVEYK